MSKQVLNTLNHCSYQLNVHLILVTKYRKKCITKLMLQSLHGIMDHLLKKWGCELMEFNGEADHLHLLISLNPKVTPSKLVNNLKTVSSRLIRKRFSEHLKSYYWKPLFWSRSYCIISCGGAPLTILKQYIKQQSSPEI